MMVCTQCPVAISNTCTAYYFHRFTI